jgi:hypothetical protein
LNRLRYAGKDDVLQVDAAVLNTAMELGTQLRCVLLEVDQLQSGCNRQGGTKQVIHTSGYKADSTSRPRVSRGMNMCISAQRPKLAHITGPAVR